MAPAGSPNADGGGAAEGGGAADGQGHRPPRWHVVLTGPGTADQRRDALDFVAVSVGQRPGTYQVEHHCPTCGATDHGVPSLTYSRLALRRRGPDAPDADAPTPAVSFSRAGGWLATAWVDAADAVAGWSVGVDLEDSDSVAFTAPDELAGVGFSADEEAVIATLAEHEQVQARGLLWCAKEALVKAAGSGFTGDPSEVAVTVPGSLQLGVPDHPEAQVVLDRDWPAGPAPEHLLGAVILLRP